MNSDNCVRKYVSYFDGMKIIMASGITLHENNAVIIGNYNHIHGNSNKIVGKFNHIYGIDNESLGVGNIFNPLNENTTPSPLEISLSNTSKNKRC